MKHVYSQVSRGRDDEMQPLASLSLGSCPAVVGVLERICAAEVFLLAHTAKPGQR